MHLFFLLLIHSAYTTIPCPLSHYWSDVWHDEDSIPKSQIHTESSKNYKVLLAGCAKNIESQIDRIRPILNQIGLQFQTYHILIVEGNSDDATVQRLNDWSAQQQDILHILQRPTQFLLRTDRIAACRNEILQYAKSHHQDFHFLLMLDLDDVLQPSPSIVTNFRYRLTDWEVMTVNRHHHYYDVWALRDPLVLDYDVWKANRQFPKPWILKQQGELWRNWHGFYKNYNDELVPVRSAFAGAALYNLSFLLETPCKYEGHLNDEEWGYANTVDGPLKLRERRKNNQIEICEHVPFHNCLRDHCGRIFLNTAWKM